MMKTVFGLLLLFCCTGGICQTAENQVTLDYETTGNEFLRLCSVTNSDDFTQLKGSQLNDLLSCVYYVRGFIDGVSIERLFVKSKMQQSAPAPFCLPEHVENGQMVRVVLKYIRDNPKVAEKKAWALITAALGDAYPCH